MSKQSRPSKKKQAPGTSSSFSVGSLFGPSSRPANRPLSRLPNPPINPWAGRLATFRKSSTETPLSNAAGPSTPCPASDTPGPTDTDDSNLWMSNDASLPGGALDDLPSEAPLVDEDEPRPKKAKRPRNADGSKPEALVNNTTPPSVRMKQFLTDWANPALDALLAREAGPKEDRCKKCANVVVKSEWFRCYDCYHPQVLCRQCTVETHTQNPFHRVDRWTDEQGYWNRTSMCTLNPVIHLGHGGKKCRYSGAAPHPLTVVHEHGVDKIRVTYCDCSETRMDDALQLIRFGLFPASWKAPDTVFTIHVMEEFHLLGLQTQTNARDFMTYLRRLQDNVCPDKVTDRYREFLTANREFAFLTAVKRADTMPSDKMGRAVLAILCPACPQPDINMDPNWKDRPKEDWYLDALFHTVDGNFKSNQKDKPLDSEDTPLTMNAAYFANEKDFAEFQRVVGDEEKEVSTCHEFGAMGYGTYQGKVSGVVGFSCGRHMFVLPLGGVDLQKGERFKYVDFAALSCLQRWRILRLHVSGYDINCQYRINLRIRLQWFKQHFGHAESIRIFYFPWTIAAVGKFHLPAHTAACRYKFSYNFLPGVGMTDGEAPERIWSTLNSLGASTREMTPGHRHDTINDFHSDMNVRRTHTIAKQTIDKFNDATVHLERAELALAAIENALDEKLVAKWKEDEAQWLEKVVDMDKHKGLKNPYEPPKENLTRKHILSTLNTEAQNDKGMGRGLVGAIAEGVDLQEMKHSLLEKLADKDARDDTAANLRQRFMVRVDAWREAYAQSVQPLVDEAIEESIKSKEAATNFSQPTKRQKGTASGSQEAASGSKASGSKKRKRGAETTAQPVVQVTMSERWKEVEDIDLDLPSALDAAARASPALANALRVELELRRGQANDALDELRFHLITQALALTLRRGASGENESTRAGKIVRQKGAAVKAAAETYRRLRERLLTMGLDPEDTTFRPLAAADVKIFTALDTERQLGDSRKQPSWLWSDFRFLEIKDGVVDPEVMKKCAARVEVHWYRCSALVARWREETRLLKAEMERIVRFFSYFKKLWERKAEDHKELHDGSRAAYAQKQAARYGVLHKNSSTLFKDAVEVSSL